jgi:hypothetical protein
MHGMRVYLKRERERPLTNLTTHSTYLQHFGLLSALYPLLGVCLSLSVPVCVWLCVKRVLCKQNIHTYCLSSSSSSSSSSFGS